MNINFDKLFEKINSNQKKEIEDQIKEFFKGDTKYMSLKKKAKKNSDYVPDFLDHIYTVYEKQIDEISKKYKMDYDEIAQLFIAM